MIRAMAVIPSVFGSKLQFEPVRKWTEMNDIGHTHERASSEQAWGTNGILEGKSLSKNAHRTMPHAGSVPG
jgi:hypothetical protein